MPKTKEIISILSKFTPCDVSDALVKYGSTNGGYLPNLVLRSKVASGVSSVVGPAYTVLYAPKSDPRPAVKQSYIDEIPEDSVLVIGLPLSCQKPNAPYVTVNNALYGGLMSTRAQYRGSNGSVVLGRIRDLDEHIELGHPVWSYGVGSTAPGPVVKVVGINVPLEVRVGDDESEIIGINPGDFIVGDKNGIVKLEVGDESKLEQILEYIPKRVDADTKVSEDIKKGKGASESQKLWRGKI
ncbi:4-hydroxy-4-methyl-2-oxoglutarate aldolase [[Candida] railenensis]|uniref:4-hydroxy-4-methyl-2-oxoglutarate aldolase n=1 Tax=[Candida] railenensis TaxID=45579 RepID=A0A9P0VWN2_9ASCO|nr:4-hydroxy-4-methyl-2-oxoglutarate aldolase [[Candida] railenensis]